MTNSERERRFARLGAGHGVTEEDAGSTAPLPVTLLIARPGLPHTGRTQELEVLPGQHRAKPGPCLRRQGASLMSHSWFNHKPTIPEAHRELSPSLRQRLVVTCLLLSR